MQTIALIMPYYGKYPNYFELWLKSASFNKSIDFYVVTDIESSIIYPENVKMINIGFKELKNRIEKLVGFSIKLETPYKLCDYKPLYGLLFQEMISRYDFWGHCDSDIIWGDLRKFITENILNQYDKVYTRGHLTLYKNNQTINKICLEQHLYKSVYTYKEAFSTNYICHYDEWGGISEIFKKKKIDYYDNIEFADIRYDNFHFELAKPRVKTNQLKLFHWDKGELRCYTVNGDRIVVKEYAYIHLQKRKMEIMVELVEDQFGIVPNKFIKIKGNEINIDHINKLCYKKTVYWEHIVKRPKMIIEKIITGAISQKYKRLVKKISI
jgi:hypothetical protein